MRRYLDLSFCSQLTDRALRALRPLQHLKALHLDGVHRLTNAALCEALGETLSLRNPQRDLSDSLGSRLRHLWLDGESLTDDWLSKLLERLPKLEELALSFCENLTDRSLETLLQHSRSRTPLKSLTLRKGFNLNDQRMEALLLACPCLETLDLTECHRLGARSGAAVGHCAKLTTLVLNWCWAMTDDSVAKIVKGCPLLRELRLVGLKSLSSSPLLGLPSCCPLLRELDLRQCDCKCDGLSRPVCACKSLLTRPRRCRRRGSAAHHHRDGFQQSEVRADSAQGQQLLREPLHTHLRRT